jgi:hypothetical protein
MASNDQALKRLLELSKLHTDEDARNEQSELVKQLAISLDIQLETADQSTHETDEHEPDHIHEVDKEENHSHEESEHVPTPEVKEVKEEKPVKHEVVKPVEKPKPAPTPAPTPTPTPTPAPAPVSEAKPQGFSSARDRFEQESKAKKVERNPLRKSMPPPKRDTNPAPAGGNECDLSDPKVIDAYENVRDDNTDANWLILGYGGSKKTLQLYGSGDGGLQEFVSKLPAAEVVYGYVRVKYGDSGRAKFVFVTYVPDSLSGLAKAKANMHKPSVDRFLKYFHIQVNATASADLQEAPIQAKLHAAGGANYGTGGQAPAGSENFGNIKNNARSFFSETEKRGSVAISYNKDPLSSSTPVSLMGRAGITEKYIST